MPEKTQQSFLDFKLLNRIIRLADPYRLVFYFSMFMSMFLAILAIARPLIIIYATDHYISAGHFEYLKLKQAVIIMAVLAVVEAISRYFFNYITAWLGQSIVKDMRVRVYNHVVHSRLKYFDNTPIGTSTTRTITDIEAINDTFSEGLISIVADLLTIVAVLTAMLYVNWKVALASMAVMPVLLWFTRWFQEGVKKSFQDERTQIARLNAFLQEHITGMRIVQMFAVEDKEEKKFIAINKELRDANIRGIWYYSLFFPAVEVCLAVAIGLMVWMAAHQILSGDAFNHNPLDIKGVGIIAGFVLLINMLFRPLRFIADKVNVIQRGIVAAERVFKLLDKDEAIADKGSFAPAKIEGKIEFDDVWFAYNQDDYVLKGVSFTVNPGETLAIVGATGSGKTSTISTLGRFYEINRGAVKIDDVDIRDYKLAALRSKMSVVLQDVFLFAGSVYENIVLRNENISREQVVHAAKLVGAHSFISRLPGGYDYEVMERGATLSMGQRQLISFVRALVYDPAILILDEATSSIDTESEWLVQRAIEELVKGRTSIVIAHRLSTIRHAHKIMVLDKGELKEFGTHDELLKLNGYYKRLYDMQFMKEKIAESAE
ncbi:MAG TPA: ABC transporter ATP-binding protein [Chitinophagales bacterium]|nr:ABC transporter ATP-binding protein [Chitinophagales bacterium]